MLEQLNSRTFHPVPYAIPREETAAEHKARVIQWLKTQEAFSLEEEEAAPTHFLKAMWRGHAIECAKIVRILGG